MITAFGLACGLFVIFKVNMTEVGTGIYQMLYSAALLVLLAALADLIDGAVARAMKAESEFGVMFDSLSDAISFGVAPSVLMLKSLSLEQGTPLSFFSVLAAMIFSICGVLRLVRFNVKASEAKQNEELAIVNKKHFTGLPIPSAALGAISLNLFLSDPRIASNEEGDFSVKAFILICSMFILGYFMISRWKFPSLKALDFRVPSFSLVLGTVFVALFLLYGVLYFFSLALVVIVWAYILLGWVLSLIRLFAGKKSLALKDYEPEEENED